MLFELKANGIEFSRELFNFKLQIRFLLLQCFLFSSKGENAWYPFPEADCNKDKTENVSNHLFKKHLISGIADHDVFIQTREIIGDIQQGPEKDQPKTNRDKDPALAEADILFFLSDLKYKKIAPVIKARKISMVRLSNCYSTPFIPKSISKPLMITDRSLQTLADYVNH